MQRISNRRKIERMHRRIPVRFGSKDPQFMGFTSDISTDGLSIKTSRVFPPGTPLMLGLTIDGNSLSAQGEVRWAKRVPPNLIRIIQSHMGLRFTLKSDPLRKYLNAASGP